MERVYANQLEESMLGRDVEVAGWVEDIRELGAIVFIIVRDVSGGIQVVAEPSMLTVNEGTKVTRQSSVRVRGRVQRSRSVHYPLEIRAEALTVYSIAKHPLPIDPTGRVSASLDARLDARALDLRNPSVAAIFKLRHHALQMIRRVLVEKGFMEVNTPKIIGSASEGGANLFRLTYFNNRQAYLAQSPQLYKEQLTLALDRVFEIASYYRAEKSHTTRHLSEFVSVDIEAAYMDADGVMRVAEELMVSLLRELKERCSRELSLLGSSIDVPSPPFPRITYMEAVEMLRKDHGISIEFGDDLSDHALKLLGESIKGFYFIVDWPTKLKPFYIHERDDDPNLSYSFDLQYGALELASGGKRLHDASRLRSRLVEQGLNPDDFRDHLKVFEWGMPPHAGWGLGLDRLMTVICNVKNVREVVLYPRDTERLNP
ncbi:MAG: aspartate--tRNA(Asn) ligase [Candidatus Nitrosocaldus sp.]|nr:aspartate--tRNA(Asn) ligase [Candidatus Nitrosocaldus sp.]MDW8275969.1 aspartate--tRNA(Asn) ligase [Candidatus Nitrosocaldus sp.]